MVGDVSASKCWTKIMQELSERRLVEEVECFVLGDNKLDQMVDQALRGERCYTWLAGK